MRNRWASFALTVVAAASFMGLAATSVAQIPDELRVDVSLKDADMITATQMLTKQTGAQFIVETSNEPFPKITLKIDRVTADEAIRYICQSAGATFRRDENGVYIISRGKPATEATTRPIETLPVPALPKRVEKFKMMKADARDVYNQLTMGLEFDPTFGFRQINRFRDMTTPRGINAPVLQFAGNGQPNFTPSAAPSVTGMETGADIRLPGDGARQGGFGGGIPGGGGGGIGGGQGGGIGGGIGGGGQGGGLGGGQGQGATLQGGQGLVGQSIDFISFDPTDNSLVVRGSEEDIAELQRNIALFDVAPRQVIIKVEFITTSSSIAKSLGFDWLYQRGTVFAGNRPGSFARAGDPIFINYATGNVTTRLRTLLQEGYGKTVQAPIIRTLNNQPASVQQQVQTTVFVNQVVSAGNGQIIITSNPQTLPISTGLNVAPRINGDDTITMFLSPTVSDFGQLRRGPDGQEVPDVLSQIISVVARVKNNETIVLGGLTRKAETGSTARFPILSDLPIIGQFFRASNKDRNTSELLVFVTPTIVEDDGSGTP